MVATFLRAEIVSPRHQARLLDVLQQLGGERRIIDGPDLSSAEENALRTRVLGAFRGYRQDRALFQGFPDDVRWHRCTLDPEDLSRIRYVNYSYWIALTGGTRRPADAVPRLRAGSVIFGQDPARLLNASQALEAGTTFPEMILVGTDAASDLVVLEGHLRLTAYALAPQRVPSNLTALVGFSPQLRTWMV